MLLRIFFGEQDRFAGRPLYDAIVQKARELHLAGATVLRGPMGYGRNSRIHRANLFEISEDLPIVVEIVDTRGQRSTACPARTREDDGQRPGDAGEGQGDPLRRRQGEIGGEKATDAIDNHRGRADGGGTSVTVLDEVLAANATYASQFGDKGSLALPPARQLAILTCMDARLDPAKYTGREGLTRKGSARPATPATSARRAELAAAGSRQHAILTCKTPGWTPPSMRGSPKAMPM